MPAAEPASRPGWRATLPSLQPAMPAPRSVAHSAPFAMSDALLADPALTPPAPHTGQGQA